MASVFQYYYYRLIAAAAAVVSVVPASVVPVPTGSTTTTAVAAARSIVLLLSSIMMTTTTAAAVTTAAPLYITVGPPCAGKTTWIRERQQHLQQSITDETKKPQLIHDVSIDDQDGVYVPVPTSWFLAGQHDNSNSKMSPYNGNDDDDDSGGSARRLILHGKSAYDRIQDQVELRAILARLSNQITRADCAAKLGQPPSTEEATRGIVAAVEEYMLMHNNATSTADGASAPDSTTTTTIQLPETIDLFVVEALFRDDRPADDNHNNNNHNRTNNNHRHHQNQHPNTSSPGRRSTGITTSTRPSRTGGGGGKGGAIARAGQALRDQVITDAIVWGNTNCRSTDYQDALQLATRQGRPVHFVVYSEPNDDDQDHDNHDKDTKDDDNDTTGQQQGLYAKNLQELFRRSIGRLVRTGRYIPSHVICDMRLRCLEMTKMATTTAAETNHRPEMMMMMTGIELKCHLARLAQYELDPLTRQVRALAPPKRRLSDDQPNPYHKNVSPQRGGSPAKTRTPPREPWRGGILPGMNNQYGNYRATTTNSSSIPRGSRWGSGGGSSLGGDGRLHEPGGGRYRSGNRDDTTG
jgi:hypothetical protein